MNDFLPNPTAPDYDLEVELALDFLSAYHALETALVLAVLSDLDVQLQAGLKAGRIVQMPNGTHFEPVGKRDGSVDIKVRVSREVDKNVNSSFRGRWANAANKGKDEAEIFAQWDADHPEDPVEI